MVNNVDEDLKLTEAGRAAFCSIQCRAGISVPLLKSGSLLGIVTVHQAEPRTWTADDVSLLEEVAERTWAAAEHTRAEAALRASEERHRALFDAVDEGVCLFG
ncbi:MAG: GAF domain-containing protein [Caldilineaceae bacterium]